MLLRGGANYGTGCINICGAGWLWAKLLRGGLRAKLLRGGASYCGEGRTTGQAVSTFVVRAGCGPSYCGADYGLSYCGGGASYCGEGRTTGQDVSIFVVRAGCGPSY